MAVTIVCTIISYGLSTTNFSLNYSCTVLNGGVIQGLNSTVTLPLPLGNDKATNKAILQSISDTAFSALGVTIQPSDIYIPFAGND